MTMTASASAQAADGLSTIATPKRLSLSALPRSRFHTVTAKPASASRRAMWPPMMPVPISAIWRAAVMMAYADIAFFTDASCLNSADFL
jgi:hypothetical protein